MKLLLAGGCIYKDGTFKRQDILLDDGLVFFIKTDSPVENVDRILKLKNKFIAPGFADVHVHLREPGFSYKETISSGTHAAAKGGYTAVCTMPNLSPAPDCLENLKIQTDIIKKDALIDVFPFASITKKRKGYGELSDIKELSGKVVGFSDDGTGIKDEETMLRAMREVKKYSSIISAHCEDISLIKEGACIHDGRYAKANNFIGISSESEYKQVERDIKLVRKTNCAYHVCHVSTRQSIEAIRKAKKEGLNVTCESAPHYLVLCEDDLKDDGRYKMNPPLRSREDRLALVEALKDDTIDMIATDHAPHSKLEKSKGLSGSLMGITGIEASFSVLYTYLVKTKIITLEKLMDKLCTSPRKRFSLPDNSIEENKLADLTIFDIDTPYELKCEDFISMGKSTPFDKEILYGRIYMTIHNGRIVWENNLPKN